MRHVIAVASLVVLGALPASAASRAEVDELIGLLGLSDIIEIMADEGEGYGDDLRKELLGDTSSAQWDQLIATLYAPEAMMEIFRTTFEPLMADASAKPLLDFFGSDLGQRIISAEISARSALLDDDIEEAAGERLARMRDEGDARLELLEDYVETNDLIENNVVGALNSSYAFYSGLASGDAFAGTLTEDQILTDVWSQEEDVRVDTVEWIYAYLAMAYGPFDDAELTAYIDLSKSEDGQTLNRALFDAFDDMYVAISEGLGRGAAQLMVGEEL